MSELSWGSLEVLDSSGVASPVVDFKLFPSLIGIWNLPRAAHTWSHYLTTGTDPCVV